MVSLLHVSIFRTGKRTPLGALKDGYNSAIRYYYNNFADGFRQVRNGEREGGRKVIKMENSLLNILTKYPVLQPLQGDLSNFRATFKIY